MKRKDTQSVQLSSGIHRELKAVNEQVLMPEEDHSITHAPIFRMGQLDHLHTYDVDRILLADYDHGEFLRTFDVESGKCLLELEWNPLADERFQGQLNCPAYALTSGGDAGYLRAFDLRGKRSMVAPTRHAGLTYDLMLSHYFDLTIVCGARGCVDAYSSFSWDHIHTFGDESPDRANAISMLPPAPLFAVGYSNGCVRIFDLETREQVGELTYPSSPIVGVTSSREYMCYAASDRVFISTLKGELLKEIVVGSQVSVIKCAYSDVLSHSPSLLTADNDSTQFMKRLLFVGLDSGQIVVYEVPSGKVVRVIEGHNERITSLLLSPNEFVISASIDGAARRYHYPTKQCTNLYYTSDGVRSISSSKDRKYFCVSGFVDNKAKVIDRETGTIHRVFNHQNSIRCSLFADVNGRVRLFTGGWDRVVNEWDVESGSAVRSFRVPGRVAELKSQNNLLYIGYYDRYVIGGFEIVDLQSGATVLTRDCHIPTTTPGRAIVLLPMGDNFISAGDDGMVHLWNRQQRKVTKTLACGSAVRSLIASFDGTMVIAGLNCGEISLWNITNDTSHRLPASSVASLTMLLSTEKHLYAGDSIGCIYRYDMSTLSLIEKRDYHSARVWDFEYDEPNDLILSASEDGTLKFIRISDGEVLVSLYNIDDGFLWMIPDEGRDGYPYYWTNRLDRVLLQFRNSEIGQEPDASQRRDYHRVFNNQKLVMSRINGSGHFNLLKMSSAALLKQSELHLMSKLLSARILNG
jgi:WD40 repeat protein